MVATSRVEVDASAGFVRFKPLMEADRDTRYNCTATNDVGFDSDIGQLRVLGGWSPDTVPHQSGTVTLFQIPPLSSFGLATVCQTVRPMLSDCLSYLSVCNVGILWPNG